MTATYRRETATAANRLRQHKAEARLEEIVSVASIADDYEGIDRKGDLEMERQFGLLYQLMDDEDERTAVVRTFVRWETVEREETTVVVESVDDSVELIKANNDLWLSDGCGPDGTGRAA